MSLLEAALVEQRGAMALIPRFVLGALPSSLAAMLLPLSEVHAQGTEQAEQTRASIFQHIGDCPRHPVLCRPGWRRLLVAGSECRSGRSRWGKEQLALWLGLPVLGLLVFLFLVGGFNACGG